MGTAKGALWPCCSCPSSAVAIMSSAAPRARASDTSSRALLGKLARLVRVRVRVRVRSRVRV